MGNEDELSNHLNKFTNKHSIHCIDLFIYLDLVRAANIVYETLIYIEYLKKPPEQNQ